MTTEPQRRSDQDSAWKSGATPQQGVWVPKVSVADIATLFGVRTVRPAVWCTSFVLASACGFSFSCRMPLDSRLCYACSGTECLRVSDAC